MRAAFESLCQDLFCRHLLIKIRWRPMLNDSVLGICWPPHSSDPAWCKHRIRARRFNLCQGPEFIPWSDQTQSLFLGICWWSGKSSYKQMRDNPFLPSSVPCFDPFPVLQLRPPSLWAGRPTSPKQPSTAAGHILPPPAWVNARGTLPLSLIPSFRKHFNLAAGSFLNVAPLVHRAF